MESVKSYWKGRLGREEMEKVRDRSRHVIVLMLENRSFDHMLGYLQHPKEDEFRGLAKYPPPKIPLDRNHPDGSSVGPNKTATGWLGVDPPHGHLSALQQLHLDGATFRMDGFPTAYGQKLAGKEAVTTPRWGRISIACLFLAGVLAAALYEVARMGILGGWRRFVPWLLAGLLLCLLLHVVLHVVSIPGISGRNRVLLVVVPGGVGALAVRGLTDWVQGEHGFVLWTAVTEAAVFFLLWRARKRMKQKARVPPGRERKESANIMKCMAPEQIPVLAKLACEFAVCTRWYSSVPGATWPNRNFAHAGTSDESVDIEIGFYDDRTIFDLLDDAYPDIEGQVREPTWRIYYDQMPQVMVYERPWMDGRIENWSALEQLTADIGAYREDNVTLPKYAFVEPCHQGDGANSQHPGNNEEYGSDDFARGEALIAEIYNALVANPEAFRHTVLLITYDEHGGFYDHSPPPKAVAPDPFRGRSRNVLRRLAAYFVEYPEQDFPFTHLGVRVPAVVVSPWITPGTISDRVYDHASIPATVHRRFAPDECRLSSREEQANDFLHLLLTGQEATVPTLAGPEMVRAMAFREDAPDVPRRISVPTTRTGDSFGQQLAALEDMSHGRFVQMLQPEAAREAVGLGVQEAVAEGDIADRLEATPAIALFRAAAEQARRGNPLRGEP